MTHKKRSQSRRQAVGALLLVLGLVLALSFLPRTTGLPVLLGRAQRITLGRAAALMPVYLSVAGLLLLIAGDRARFSRRIAALVLGTLVGLATYHSRVPRGEEIMTGIAGEGTGVVGGLILSALRMALGDVGAWLVIMLSAIGTILLWTGIPLAHAMQSVSRALATIASPAGRTAVAIWDLLVAALSARRNAIASVLTQILQRATVTAPRPIPPAPPHVSDAIPHAQSVQPLPVPVSVPQGFAPSEPAEREDTRTRRRTGADAREDAARSQVEAFHQESLVLEVPSGGYRLPPLSLLTDLPGVRGKGKTDPTEVAKALEQTLASFGVEAKVVRWEQGPVVTRFEVQPAPGVRVQKINILTNDIALALAAPSVRIEAPIPGKSAVGIELPNQKTSLVHIKEILASDECQRTTTPLVVALGKDIAGHPILADLAEMPHLLIAGATGSGKSVMLNAIIAGLLFRCTPLDVRLLMIDPKRIEFAHYDAIPHLLAPVVTNPRAAAGALKEILREMEDRFERFASHGIRNIDAYNQLSDVPRLPHIVIVVDELADLMMVAPADFEDVICRLAQMTRATGIHMVVATQRPSVDVITGLIKANIPSRIAFAVSSQVDSRTILDMPGAEKLLGKGDMLFLPVAASRPIRAQGAFIADSEVQALVAWWKSQGKPVYDQDVLRAEKGEVEEDGAQDELLADAARLIVRSGYASVSLLQRKMKIGYVRAARIIDQLEEKGIVGPSQGSNPREVLVGLDELHTLVKTG